MIPAAFREAAESRDGLRNIIRSAVILRALGGSGTHLSEAVSYGADQQGIGPDELYKIIKQVREEVYPAN